MEATYASRRDAPAADYYSRRRGEGGQQLSSSSRNYDRSYYDHENYRNHYEYPSKNNNNNNNVTTANNSRGYRQSSRRTRDAWDGSDVDYPVNPTTYQQPQQQQPAPDLAFSSMVGSAQGSRRPSVSQSRPQTRSGTEPANLFGQLLDGLAAYHQEKLRSAAAVKAHHSRARGRRSDGDSDEGDDGLIYGDHSDSDGYYPRRSAKQMSSRARDGTARYREDRPRAQPASRDHSPHSRAKPRPRQSSHRTEEREPTWMSHSRRASLKEDDEMPDRPPHAERPRSRRPSYGSAENSTIAALENLVQIERRAVEKCRARLQRASQHPSITSRDLRELVDDLRSHEESYEAATRSLRETVQQQKLGRTREEVVAGAATTARREPPSRRSSYQPEATGFTGTRAARAFEEREPPPTAPAAEEPPRPRAHQRRHTERRQFTPRGGGVGLDDGTFNDKDAFAAFRQRRNTDPLNRIFEHLNRTTDNHFTSTRLPGGGFHFRASFGGGGSGGGGGGGGPNFHRAFDDHEDIFRAFFGNLPPGFDFPDIHPFFPSQTGRASARGQQQQGQYKYARNPPPTATAAPRVPRPQPPPANLLTPEEARRWFQTYTERWTALSPTDPNIPFPARGLHASALAARDSLHAPGVSTPVAAWSEEDVLQANAQAFFLGAVGLAPAYTENPASRKVGMGFERAQASEEQIKMLAEVLKREKVRWHSDRLGRRNGGGAPGGDGAVNEALQKDERARAVFHAVCELMERVQEQA